LYLFPRCYGRYAQSVRTPTPADPADLTAALAFALRFDGRKLIRKADETLAKIVAKRRVEHLERSGFVVMKKPPAARLAGE
jgi:hypothetical protein